MNQILAIRVKVQDETRMWNINRGFKRESRKSVEVEEIKYNIFFTAKLGIDGKKIHNIVGHHHDTQVDSIAETQEPSGSEGEDLSTRRPSGEQHEQEV